MMSPLSLFLSARRAASRHLSSRHARGAALTIGTALMLGLSACHDGAVDPTAPGAATRATLGFNAQVVATGAATELRVVSSYLQLGGGRVPLGTQATPLTSDREQLVPNTIDLGACLRDPQRQSGTVPASADDCLVQLEVQLVIDGAVVDRATIGPLSLRGGQTQTLGSTITLREVGEVRVRAGADSGTTRLEVGRTLALTGTVLDGAQRPVAGRTLEWSSSAPSVATVTAAGVVSAVSPGTARISAGTGGRTGAIDVRVVAPPQLLRIVPGGLSGNGTVRSVPAGIDCTIAGQSTSGTCAVEFPSDVEVELVTTVATGSEFLGWSGNCGGITVPVCRIAMRQPATTGPVLRALGTITLTAAGTGAGLVTSEQGGISCQMAGGVTAGTCTGTFVQGTLVTLRAAPTGISAFTGWSGACTGSAPTCVVEVNAAKSVTARFELQVSIGVQGSGFGSGTVTSSPAGISCTFNGSTPTGSCIALFNQGTSVTLTAAGQGNNTLRRWGGDCSSATGNSCTLSATGSSRTVFAQFEPPASISVSLAGTGAGEVTGGLISCQRANGSNSGVCTTSVTAGSTVTLTATPQAGSEFTGWTGACSGSTASTCTFVAEGTTRVAATFRTLDVVVTVVPNSASTGNGFVYADSSTLPTSAEEPACSMSGTTTEGTCSVTVRAGTRLTLVAESLPGSEFVAWTGPCESLTSRTCTFVPQSAVTITARFRTVATELLVQASSASTGSGDVESFDAPISCTISTTTTSGSCRTTVTPNSMIILRAFPRFSWSFTGWGGACASAGSSYSCDLSILPGLNTVTARFAPAPTTTITAQLTGFLGGTMSLQTTAGVTINSCTRAQTESTSPTSCVWTVPQGVELRVVLSPAPDAAGQFGGDPSQPCYQLQGTTCTVPARVGPATISASFFAP